MNLIEKSKQYADGKAINALTTAIEEAYAAGYKDGYSDGQSNREESPFEAKYANLNYINLELPSKTKWAVGYLKLTDGSIALLDFISAERLNIPTKEQYQELLDNTDKFFQNKTNSNGTEFVSKINGAKFYLPGVYYSEDGKNNIPQDNYVFWLKDELKSGLTRLGVYGAFIKETGCYYKLPVVLVSK